MSLYGLLQRPGPNGFGYNSTAEEVTEGLDLTGKTYLVTGVNSGLGGETLRVLSKRGARVIAAARTADKARAACSQVRGETLPVACELSEPDSVRETVKTVLASGLTLDGIIANAGIMALPERTVKHGLELQFLTNHIGHFILVTGVLDRLSDTGRVVMLSSSAHRQSYKEGIRFDDLDASGAYSRWGSYGQSKLANLLFATHLSTRLQHPGQTANAVHPGVIATNLGRHLGAAFNAMFQPIGNALALKSIPQGAATQIYVATHPRAASASGVYFRDCNITESSRHGRDRQLAARLWDKTEELIAAL